LKENIKSINDNNIVLTFNKLSHFNAS
jgi:hypothetical protein